MTALNEELTTKLQITTEQTTTSSENAVTAATKIKTRDPPKGSCPASNKRLQTKPVQRFGRIVECCIENKQNEK